MDLAEDFDMHDVDDNEDATMSTTIVAETMMLLLPLLNNLVSDDADITDYEFIVMILMSRMIGGFNLGFFELLAVWLLFPFVDCSNAILVCDVWIELGGVANA
ncbi:hypothetical protein PanWU01x14_200830 [Parasponia andersonii]|uniref:Uncharacterized protein n=1 Tax=Parasponia andersonii TaxID=3476 RepID=A0A2P5BXY9_PARAD|nr:hypothetical protein PanWU01x14_200830 [Parasponia andersonii]